MQQAIYKVPDGKLLKIFLEMNEGVIGNLKITGDFFIYPEEKIKELEEVLKGESIDETVLLTKVNDFVTGESLELFGVDSESIVKTILMAAEAPNADLI